MATALTPPRAPEVQPGSTIVRNMSAPPRMRIDITPYGDHPGLLGRHSDGEVWHPINSFAAVAEANLDVWVRVPRNVTVIADISHHRLARVTRLAQTVVAGCADYLGDLLARDDEVLHDTLQGLIERIDIEPLALPPFAIACRYKIELNSSWVPAASPARALALVSRVSGNVFQRRRRPRVKPLLEERSGWTFHAPTTKPGGYCNWPQS